MLDRVPLPEPEKHLVPTSCLLESHNIKAIILWPLLVGNVDERFSASQSFLCVKQYKIFVLAVHVAVDELQLFRSCVINKFRSHFQIMYSVA